MGRDLRGVWRLYATRELMSAQNVISQLEHHLPRDLRSLLIKASMGLNEPAPKKIIIMTLANKINVP